MPPEPPSIAVIIPAFNAETRLRRAVESVWETGYPTLDVVIVDDGSGDRTVEIAEQLCREAPAPCRVLRHPNSANLGVSATRNLGIAATKSDWVAFLDADDAYLPRRFGDFECQQFASQDIDGIFGTSLVMSESNGIDSNYEVAGEWLNASGEAIFGLSSESTGEALLGELLEGRCWATSAITLSRKLLDLIGGFDVNKRIAEDCDLWFRAAAAGNLRASRSKGPLSVYYRHDQNTFHHQIINRIPMIKAMTDAWTWALTTRCCGPGRASSFRRCVPRYFHRALVASLDARRADVGVDLLRIYARRCPLQLLLQMRTLRLSLAVLLRHWRGSTAGDPQSSCAG